jgi:hypothetical protein
VSAREIILGECPGLEGGMDFKLTYAGPLYATQRDPVAGQAPKHTQNRHDIRRKFHVQLRKLWESIPDMQRKATLYLWADNNSPEPPAQTIDDLAKKYAMYGFNFVPLVTQELDLMCSLDILFLRSGRPGSVVWPGDIDNRLKTLLDALRIPEAGENYSSRCAGEDEKPLFCLLEDDKLITRVAVETDDLLEPLDGKLQIDPADSRLIITVKIKPYHFSPFNSYFG